MSKTSQTAILRGFTASNVLSFASYLVVFSLFATLLHEYVHYVVLKLSSGEGLLYFSFTFQLFPWDDSHVIVTRAPPNQIGGPLFALSGGAVAATVVAALMFLEREKIKRVALEFVLFPQITWAVSEPLVWLVKQRGSPIGDLPQALQQIPVYYTLLLLSWFAALLHIYLSRRKH